MQQIEYVDRANEELRRLGWEVRRTMRWATTSHHRIWRRLLSLKNDPPPEPHLLTPLLSHVSLSCLSPPARRLAVTVILKNQYIKITNLQLAWHEGIQEVFTQTKHQTGDEDLVQTWNSQLHHITALHQGGMSMIAGVVDIPMNTVVLGTEMVAAVDDVLLMEDNESDTSSLDAENDDVVSGLVHRLDLVDIIAAVDPTTMGI